MNTSPILKNDPIFYTYAVARNVSEWGAAARAAALVSTVNRGRDSLWRGAGAKKMYDLIQFTQNT